MHETGGIAVEGGLHRRPQRSGVPAQRVSQGTIPADIGDARNGKLIGVKECAGVDWLS